MGEREKRKGGKRDGRREEKRVYRISVTSRVVSHYVNQAIACWCEQQPLHLLSAAVGWGR